MDLLPAFILSDDRNYLDDEFLAVRILDNLRDCPYTLLRFVGSDSKLFSESFKPPARGGQYNFLFLGYYDGPFER